MKRISSFLSLFTSMSTVLCCALPALFVVLGMGAAFADLVSAVPQLIWISEHKVYFFIFGGFMLLISGLLQWKTRSVSCGAACKTTRDWSIWVYFVSVGMYAVGFVFAFVTPWFLK